ncbi:GNAT family N-acetyltransferase [Gallaecimonas pentaromativorans]|uniref:GNAT family N-acetyltransferase n=1 Tax=Gallaecimonas pentaromativorans TaxID=584787 RepID=UPI00067F49B1|nr:GNAT family protein [Gallaecimonas pentaromativorans]MED5524525.1 GNAT family protein [Pseudomonadota bacterium]
MSRSIYEGFATLYGQRVSISPLGKADLIAFTRYRAEPAIARYQGWQDYQLSDAEALFAGQCALPFPHPDSWYQLAIHDAGGELLGDLALHWLTAQEAEVGFTLAPASQGQGYASEALKLLLAWLFGQGCLSVKAAVDTRNVPSYRLLERCGFTRTSCHKDAAFFKGEWYSEYHYRLERHHWQGAGDKTSHKT